MNVFLLHFGEKLVPQGGPGENQTRLARFERNVDFGIRFGQVFLYGFKSGKLGLQIWQARAPSFQIWQALASNLTKPNTRKLLFSKALLGGFWDGFGRIWGRFWGPRTARLTLILLVRCGLRG